MLEETYAYFQLHLANPGVMLGAVLVLIGLLRNFLTLIIAPEIYGRASYKKGTYATGTFKRKQLDHIRAKSNEFPKPYPNGWYKICESEEIPTGKVLTVSALGREFIVFRGENNTAGVLDAFCPHLGTHLGHGGVVKDGHIVCPYHLWEFNCEGKNKNIPYCKKDMTGHARVNVKGYPTKEISELGAVFFWFHAEKELAEKPQWDIHRGLLDIAKEVKEGRMKSVTYSRWDDMLFHVMEPSQNSADDFHFATVHQYLPLPFNLRLLKVKHTIRTYYGQNEDARAKYGITRDELMIREVVDEIRFLDLIPLPGIITKFISTHVQMQGPNNILFMVDTPFGRIRIHFALLPEEPFRMKATTRVYSDNSVPWIITRMLNWWTRETAEQDKQVWEHKLQISPRNVVVGDGPFVPYGKWLEFFYSDNSLGWEEIVGGTKLGLDW